MKQETLEQRAEKLGLYLHPSTQNLIGGHLKKEDFPMFLKLIRGNCLQELPKLPSESVDLVLTSPPYWGLRDYGVEGQLGGEETLEAYFDVLMAWVKESHRILKPSGSLVLNLGGLYLGGGRGSRESRENGKEKDEGFAGGHRGTKAPEWSILKGGASQHYKAKQFIDLGAFAYTRIIQETDFVCRNRTVWCKPNVPSPIRSRLKQSWESVDWFVKNADEYYWNNKPWIKAMGEGSLATSQRAHLKAREQSGYDGSHRLKPNTRSVAEQVRYMREKARGKAKLESSAEFRAKHAGSSFSTGSFHKHAEQTIEHAWRIIPVGEKQRGFELSGEEVQLHVAPFPEALVKPWVESLCPPGGIVLDPFVGSGTTLKVARDLRRSGIGIDLNAEYLDYAKKRLNWNSGISEYVFLEESAEGRKHAA